MAQYSPGETDIIKIGFFKNLWFIAAAVGFVIFILIGVLLMGIVYSTSGLRFDPVKLGMDDLGFEDY